MSVFTDHTLISNYKLFIQTIQHKTDREYTWLNKGYIKKLKNKNKREEGYGRKAKLHFKGELGKGTL